MDIKRLAELRPRFVWDILDDAFDLYRERFAPLCGIALVFSLPHALWQVSRAASITKDSASSADFFGRSMGTLLLETPLYLVASLLCLMATAFVTRERLEGRPSSLTGALAGTFRRPLLLIGAIALLAVFGDLGLLLAGLGTVGVCLYGCFLGPILVLEPKRTPLAAWRRSVDLAASDIARVIGILGLMLVMVGAVSLGLAAVLEAGYQLLPFSGDVAAREVQKQVAGAAAQSLAFVLLSPLESAALVLLYFDLRVRREGIDLAALADERGVTLAPDPFGDLASARVVQKQSRERRREEKKAKR